MTFRSDVLPAPFGPMIENKDSFSTLKLTLFKALIPQNVPIYFVVLTFILNYIENKI